jgi:hypothetical protein
VLAQDSLRYDVVLFHIASKLTHLEDGGNDSQLRMLEGSLLPAPEVNAAAEVILAVAALLDEVARDSRGWARVPVIMAAVMAS